jgi:Protein of unknown function (DUF3768)
LGLAYASQQEPVRERGILTARKIRMRLGGGENITVPDRLRRTFTGGRVVMTDGVAALPEQKLAQLLERVRSFDAFTNDNDPYGEHDFGAIELAGQTYFFKVDYYAPDMDGGSEDPADRTKTTRVLTIMRADEY